MNIPIKQHTILITGSAGYIGSRLRIRLDELGVKYIGVDRLDHKSKNSLCYDLSDKDQIIGTIRKYKPTYIVHCGTHSEAAYKKNFLKSFKEDALSLVHILEAINSTTTIRLLFFSSSYVYGGINRNLTVNEDTNVQPENNFGIAKYFFEKLITRTHVNFLIFRLSNVFGPGQQSNPTAINSWINERNIGSTITIWGLGERNIQYIYIDDVVNYICQGNDINPSIYNIGGKEYVSMAEAAESVSEINSSPIKYIRDKTEGETLPFMDTSKLQNNLVSHEPLSFKSGIASYFSSLKDS